MSHKVIVAILNIKQSTYRSANCTRLTPPTHDIYTFSCKYCVQSIDQRGNLMIEGPARSDGMKSTHSSSHMLRGLGSLLDRIYGKLIPDRRPIADLVIPD